MSKNTTTMTDAEFATALAGLTEQIAALQAQVAPKGGKKGKAKKAAPTGLPFKEQQLALKNHKLAGAIKPGISVREAIREGLMDEFGNLPGAATKAPKVTTGKVTKAELKVALRAHKAAGAIPAGVRVKDAISEGLMDMQGNLTVRPTSAKAAKKAAKKVAKTAAKVVADAPAKVRAADGPRDALGRITPASTWDLRERLAESGKFDRFEIDAAVAAVASA